MKPADIMKRQQSASALGLAAAALLILDAVLLVPAWQSRQDAKQQAVFAQQELSRQRQMTASVSESRDTYAEKRTTLLNLEADLLPADQDTDLIRSVQALAGSKVTVISYQASDPVPLVPGETDKAEKKKTEKDAVESAPYSEVPYELQVTGGWNALTAFLQDLETKVTGFRVEEARLSGAQGGSAVLQVTGSLYRVEQPMPEEPDVSS